jgi:hypothetical protein
MIDVQGDAVLETIMTATQVTSVHSLTLGALCGVLDGEMHRLPDYARKRVEAILAARTARVDELCRGAGMAPKRGGR